MKSNLTYFLKPWNALPPRTLPFFEEIVSHWTRQSCKFDSSDNKSIFVVASEPVIFFLDSSQKVFVRFLLIAGNRPYIQNECHFSLDNKKSTLEYF